MTYGNISFQRSSCLKLVIPAVHCKFGLLWPPRVPLGFIFMTVCKRIFHLDISEDLHTFYMTESTDIAIAEAS